MRKSVVILVAVILIAAFSLVVYYGFVHSRGAPVPIESPTRVLLKSPFVDNSIDLAKGIDAEFWATLPPQDVKLLYQVMVLPWPKVVTPSVTVKTFHNKSDIYFYMSWKDGTEDRTLGIGKFSDACAIMFPLSKDPGDFPTLMMGFMGKANIWHWKANRDREYWSGQEFNDNAYADYHYPFEDKETLAVSKDALTSAVNDLISIRVTTITPKEAQNVAGKGMWSDGAWQVVFKRAIEPLDPELDAGFAYVKRLCAFAVWNGDKGDRGGRKSISDWVELEVR